MDRPVGRWTDQWEDGVDQWEDGVDQQENGVDQQEMEQTSRFRFDKYLKNSIIIRTFKFQSSFH